jgi:hypothetical protein
VILFLAFVGDTLISPAKIFISLSFSFIWRGEITAQSSETSRSVASINIQCLCNSNEWIGQISILFFLLHYSIDDERKKKSESSIVFFYRRKFVFSLFLIIYVYINEGDTKQKNAKYSMYDYTY